jgi:hypothetical protein
MKKLADETEARLTYLKRELLKSCVNSKHYHPQLNCYDPPKRAMPQRVKDLIKEIDELEKERRETCNNQCHSSGQPG